MIKMNDYFKKYLLLFANVVLLGTFCYPVFAADSDYKTTVVQSLLPDNKPSDLTTAEVEKFETLTEAPPVEDHDMGLMPTADLSTLMEPVAGFSQLHVYPTTEQAKAGGDGAGSSAFRIDCAPAFEAQIDPIVAFGKEKSMHLHEFFGNVGITKDTKPSDLAKSNSTCNGGTMNRSAYWVPVIIDTKTKAVIHPYSNIAYYKAGDWTRVVVPPKGLVMIAGNQSATDSSENKVFSKGSRFTCNINYRTAKKYIPDCDMSRKNPETGTTTLEYLLIFPECWNGKDLDSADHQSHMAYPVGNGCPASHPVRIPQVAYNIHYHVTTATGTKYWRLASDAYPWDKPGGYTMHGDWMEGWTRKGDSPESDANGANIDDITENCLRGHMDAHAHLLCNGYMFDDPKWHDGN